MGFKGIKKRWILNSLGFTVSIFTVLVVSFGLIVRGYFYSGIRQTIRGRTNELYNILNGHSIDKNFKFVDIAKVYVENFSDDKIMELMVFDKERNVIITSAGFLPEYDEIKKYFRKEC